MNKKCKNCRYYVHNNGSSLCSRRNSIVSTLDPIFDNCRAQRLPRLFGLLVLSEICGREGTYYKKYGENYNGGYNL